MSNDKVCNPYGKLQLRDHTCDEYYKSKDFKTRKEPRRIERVLMIIKNAAKLIWLLTIVLTFRKQIHLGTIFNLNTLMSVDIQFDQKKQVERNFTSTNGFFL